MNNELGPVDLKHSMGGSTLEGTKGGGAGRVVMTGEDSLHRCKIPTLRSNSSFQAETSAMQHAFAWFEEAYFWSTDLVLQIEPIQMSHQFYQRDLQ